MEYSIYILQPATEKHYKTQSKIIKIEHINLQRYKNIQIYIYIWGGVVVVGKKEEEEELHGPSTFQLWKTANKRVLENQKDESTLLIEIHTAAGKDCNQPD